MRRSQLCSVQVDFGVLSSVLEGEAELMLTKPERDTVERCLDWYAVRYREWWTTSEVEASHKALGITV
jgi:hypothetical protein